MTVKARWRQGEKELDDAIKELTRAYHVYLHEGPAIKTDHQNHVIRHVMKAQGKLLKLERELFWDD